MFFNPIEISVHRLNGGSASLNGGSTSLNGHSTSMNGDFI